MDKLKVLKKLLHIEGNEEDEILQYFLESAKYIICEIRNSRDVEPRYDLTQVKMAIELYNKQGVEGQLSHGENGLSRGYENSGISKSLLDEVTPLVRTPFSVHYDPSSISGHIIIDSFGNELPQRDKLKFANVKVVDENNVTLVTVEYPKAVSDIIPNDSNELVITYSDGTTSILPLVNIIDDTSNVEDKTLSSKKIYELLDSPKYKNLVVTVTGSPLGGFIADYSATEIRNWVNAGGTVELRFDDTVENSGEQVYSYLKFYKNLAYFRRPVLDKDKNIIRQIDITVGKISTQDSDRTVKFTDNQIEIATQTMLSELDQDKFGRKTYTVATDKISQIEVADIISDYGNYEGNVIEFLTNGELPNKVVGYGYLMTDKSGNQFLNTFNLDGTITQWNKTGFEKHNFECYSYINEPIIDLDNLTIDVEGNAPFVASVRNAMNRPEKDKTSEFGIVTVIAYAIDRQIQIYRDMVSGESWYRTITGLADNHSFGVWKKQGGSSGGAQSDWNENDVNSPAYVKNRTHWIDIEEKELVNGIISYGEYEEICQYEFILGKEYTITLGNNVYTSIAKHYFDPFEGDCIYLGNVYLVMHEGEDTGETYGVMYVIKSKSIYIYANDLIDTETAILKIYGATNNYHKIDNKFLNDKIVILRTTNVDTDSEIILDISPKELNSKIFDYIQGNILEIRIKFYDNTSFAIFKGVSGRNFVFVETLSETTGSTNKLTLREFVISGTTAKSVRIIDHILP